jgi:hypothetical protein
VSGDGGIGVVVGGEWNALMTHRRRLISRLTNSKDLKTKNWLKNFLSRFDTANMRNPSSHKSAKGTVRETVSIPRLKLFPPLTGWRQKRDRFRVFCISETESNGEHFDLFKTVQRYLTIDEHNIQLAL